MKSIQLTRGVLWAAAVVVSLGATTASGARIAADNASDVAYNAGLANGSNGGTGFGAWQISGNSGTTNTSFYGAFVGDSTTNGSSGGGVGINTAGAKAWGLYANTSNTENAVRPFTADSTGATALTVGQRFAFAFDNGNVAGGSSVGIGLRTSAGVNRLEFFFGGGSANYTLADNSGNRNTGIPFTSGGLTGVVTVTGASTYSAVITPNGGSPVTFTGTLTGTPGSSDIAQVRAFNFNAGTGNPANFFINSINISKPAVSITNGVPAAYGSQVGSLAVTGGSGSYALAAVTGLTTSRGFVAVTGFNPTSDTEIFGLEVRVNGLPASPSQLLLVAQAMGGTATAVSPSAAFPSNYNMFVTYSGASLPTGAQPYYFGYDLSTAALGLENVTVAAVAVVPEPSAVAGLGLLAVPMLRRRRV